jgi:16S rRNA (guanine966-N2)-methyltransferase
MTQRAAGQLRIIGGEWRSRRVDFDAAAGVRPTPDRVRQTVFDWLSPLISGSRVLDLFAGSGALALESLSRGATQATMVERGLAQVLAIRSAVNKFAASDRADVIQQDAISFLDISRLTPHASRLYDIVFLDPPYDSDLLTRALEALPRRLAPTHRIYIEWPKSKPPTLPPGYSLLKEKAAGQVSYGLIVHAPKGA